MKKFTINCDFGGKKAPFVFYIGEPDNVHHPLHHQNSWLSSQRGGTIPADVMKALAELHELSMKNHVSFEELCYYAMTAANEDDVTQDTEAQESPLAKS